MGSRDESLRTHSTTSDSSNFVSNSMKQQQSLSCIVMACTWRVSAAAQLVSPVSRIPSFRVYAPAGVAYQELLGDGSPRQVESFILDSITQYLGQDPVYDGLQAEAAITAVTSLDQLQQMLTESGVSVVSFKAPWCRKCRYDR